MLVYAIVLILVMIATNSPLLIGLMSRIRPRKQEPVKEGSDT